MNLEEFSTECGAYAQRYQEALDLLYCLGCEYSIKDADMRSLCDHMGVNWNDLNDHKGSSVPNH